MAVLALPVVAELSDGSLLALGDEDGVVAEPSGAIWLLGDPSLERSRASKLLSVGRQHYELADVAGAARLALRPGKIVEEPGYLLLIGRVRSGVAGRPDSRPATEPVHLEPRVLADHPEIGSAGLSPVAGLREGVLVEGRPSLFRHRARPECRDLPVWEERAELTQLVPVARRDAGFYSRHLGLGAAPSRFARVTRPSGRLSPRPGGSALRRGPARSPLAACAPRSGAPGRFLP